MIEFYIAAALVALIVLNALRRKGTPAAGTAAGVGSVSSWYQKVSSVTGLTIVLWLIGLALVWLVANKYWGEETQSTWGTLSSRENLWITILSLALLVGIVVKSILTREKHSVSASEHRGGIGRWILMTAVIGFVLLLSALVVIKILQNLEYGLSNAPERMALRGYVPAERLAANVATPLLTSEPSIIIAPKSLPGVTNWGEPFMRRRGNSTHLHYTVQPELQEWVRVWKDGLETHFTNELAAFVIKFRSITNYAVEVPLREFTEEEWQQLLRERRQ